MQLVIAEKPSVARDLARVLGLRASGKNLLQGPGRVISWCIGHLVELEEPAAYDPAWKAWRMDALPMIPATFKLRAVPATRDQLRVVRELLRDRRFTEVVNACDAGREGELIFRYVYELAGCRLPVRRLWISSLTDEAIREGFSGLRPGANYDALADAARCRSEADWLVGMNATRAVTIRFRTYDPSRRATPGGPRAPAATPGTTTAPERRTPAHPHRGGRPTGTRRAAPTWRASLPPVYSIGRVQTPTLAILVRREQAIRSFEPRPYWEVRGTFSPLPRARHHAGPNPPPQTFTASWSSRVGPDRGLATRLGVQELAEKVVERASAVAAGAGAGDDHLGVDDHRRDDHTGAGGHGRAQVRGPVVESLKQRRSREPPPQLFDLTSLQRTANRRFGFSASRTLEIAQSLYERHKVLTYPRTDSRYLPRELAPELPRLFRGLARLEEYAPFAQTVLETEGAVDPRSRRVFDDAKVHDHHAIIPTGKVPGAGALDPDERRLFDLVARRFLGAFHPDAEFALTEVVIRVGAADAEPQRQISGGPSSTGPTARGPGGVPVGGSEEVVLEAVPPPPDRFMARGRVRLVAGWQDVAGFDERRSAGGPIDSGADAGADKGAPKPRNDEDDPRLPALAEGQLLDGRFEVLARQTRPPPRHTEASLLGAMESAGREIEDETLRVAMKDAGLGTPATRAATIETLIKRGFMARQGKQIVATETGIDLIERLPVPTLSSPELTGAWESRLARIARGQDTRAAFMTDIVRYVREVTTAIARYEHDARAAAPAPVPAPAAAPAPVAVAVAVASPSSSSTGATTRSTPGPAGLTCPRCHLGALIVGRRGWGCSRWKEGCPFVVWFEIAGKRLTPAQLRDLVARGKTRPARWKPDGQASQSGRLVLDLTATREAGAARFLPS